STFPGCTRLSYAFITTDAGAAPTFVMRNVAPLSGRTATAVVSAGTTGPAGAVGVGRADVDCAAAFAVVVAPAPGVAPDATVPLVVPVFVAAEPVGLAA